MLYLTYSDSIRCMNKLHSYHNLDAPEANDRVRVNLLKGLAITAVVIIHILSSIPGHIYTTPNAGPYIFLDQLLRFSVPLFLGLSGYLLARKYPANLEIIKFYQRRLIRIVPLYLLWSIGLWILFLLIPVWNTPEKPIPFWKILLLGRSDYHLYFVPLIFQLYLLFPFLLKLLEKFPRATLFGALSIQAFSFILFNYLDTIPEETILDSDQEQYSLFTSWIFYFVLGMFIAKRAVRLHHRIKTISYIWLAWGLGLAYLGLQGQLQIFSGIDPLDALKFTRLSVLPYALSSICLAIMVPWETFSHPSWLSKILLIIGKYSFVIYLSHTIVLRLVFANTYAELNFSDMLITAIFTVLAINASYWYEKNS